MSIIWGYQGQYPIAKVEGVAYSAIPQWLIDYIVSHSNADNNETIEQELRQRLQEFRQESYVSNAMVTGYTYDPLIGVTSIIMPNGQVEYYKYDSFGRLKEVLDQNGNKLKANEYHYKD